MSGQPTEAQMADIRDLGVTHVLNLAPHTNKGALNDERATVSDLGLTYIHIPVDFDAPTDADYRTFCHALTAARGMTIHIHCIYNARVSAFIYRHACEFDDFDTDEAFEIMDSIWRPGGVWAEFIGSQDTGKPILYAGDDY